jgi:RNA polymerase sigma-70 factor (ECF subfamily)
MADTPEFGRGQPHEQGAGLAVSDLKVWFLREVLPLEAALMQFLRRSGRSKSEIDDLCQDVYVRVFEAAQKQLPQPVRPFVFTIARNLLIDHIRKGQVVPIETVAELGTLDVAFDGPGPDRVVIAREELRRLQVALDQLPDRCREAVVMRKVDGLPRREIAQRMGVTEFTVNAHLTHGVRLLADMVYGDPAALRRKS